MYLTIINRQTEQEVGKFQAETWFEAVQYVERNKDKYLVDTTQLDIIILNKKAQTCCYWQLTPLVRHSLLNDKIYPLK